MKVFLTGGAGFIGRNFVERLIQEPEIHVTVYDAFTYAVHPTTEKWLLSQAQVTLIKGDVRNSKAVEQAILSSQPDRIVHMAAESHVDRSIEDPQVFIETNVGGTFNMLEATRIFLEGLDKPPNGFLFVQVSTDEVYGPTEHEVDETSPYNPSSPYAASKAAADQLVNAWSRTYEIPLAITFSTNNYGPWQNSEKLIPKTIQLAVKKTPVPLYGDGLQARDWIHVKDYTDALLKIIRGSGKGRFNISANNEVSNLALVEQVDSILSKLNGSAAFSNTARIVYVEDRKGHDRQYRISSSKFRQQFSWKPAVSLQDGLRSLIENELENCNKSIKSV